MPRDIVENLASNSEFSRAGNLNVSLTFALEMALVAMVTKIWDSTSNNEIIVRSMAKGLGRL